ncbi:hypothetical protein T07_8677 [Trichinella nelsoni]|uniref:Uncharacterized protein n=1 Tax=Trichinella nelsoni TaxID=6336 RepID=A0A0V0RVJ1_9BILA|nr:hypothetical protein T07_8677 [Trichinella nelsoni]
MSASAHGWVAPTRSVSFCPEQFHFLYDGNGDTVVKVREPARQDGVWWGTVVTREESSSPANASDWDDCQLPNVATRSKHYFTVSSKLVKNKRFLRLCSFHQEAEDIDCALAVLRLVLVNLPVIHELFLKDYCGDFKIGRVFYSSTLLGEQLSCDSVTDNLRITISVQFLTARRCCRTIKQSTSRVSDPGSLVILENHRALKHAFVYCKLICNTSCSSTLKTKMKPEYEPNVNRNQKLSHCDIVGKKSPGTVLLLFIAAIAKLQLHIKLQTTIKNVQEAWHISLQTALPSLNDIVMDDTYNTNAVRVSNRKLQWFGFLENHRALNHVFIYCEFNSPRLYAHVKIKLAYEESNCNHGDFVVKNHRAQFGCCLQLQQQRCAAQSSCRNHGVNLAIVRSCNSNAMLQNLTRSWWFGSFTKSPDH